MTADKKATLKNTIIAAIFFAVVFGITEAFIYNIAYAAIAAPIAGIFFGLFMYLFVNSKKIKQQTSLAEKDQEGIIYSGAANHFKNAEAVGGKLYLLADRLEFKSHGFNIQNHAFNIHLTEIKELGFYKTLGLVPNGLQIVFHNGEKEKFVVNNRNSWKTEIEKLIKNGIKKAGS